MRAQVHVAADLYEKHFGRRAARHVAGRVRLRARAATSCCARRRSATSSSTPTRSSSRDRPPVFGVYAPVYCPTGVAAFGRDTESSRAGVERQGGLPRRSALPRLLPRHRLRPAARLHRPVHPPGGASAIYTGFKYHAITHDKLHDKWVYDPDVARGTGRPARRRTSAATARSRCERLAAQHGPAADRREPVRRRAVRPLVVRGAALPRTTSSASCTSTRTSSRRSRPATTWSATPPTRWRRPAPRPGGSRATASTGCNESNAWIYRHLHVAAERMVGAGAAQPARRAG